MNLRLIAVGAILSSVFASFGVQKVKIPKADILQQRLYTRGLGCLAHQIAAVGNWAEREVEPRYVALAADLLIRGCSDQKGNLPGELAQIPEIKIYSMLLEAFLEDDPEALQELEKEELYIPSDMHNAAEDV